MRFGWFICLKGVMIARATVVLPTSGGFLGRVSLENGTKYLPLRRHRYHNEISHCYFRSHFLHLKLLIKDPTLITSKPHHQSDDSVIQSADTSSGEARSAASSFLFRGMAKLPC